MRVRNATRRLITLAALLFTLWLIWSRLHIVLFVQIPWWGLLIVALLIFLTVDYLLSKIMTGR